MARLECKGLKTTLKGIEEIRNKRLINEMFLYPKIIKKAKEILAQLIAISKVLIAHFPTAAEAAALPTYSSS